MQKEKIYCFDFDGTLTTKDTLIEFIRYSKGNGKFLLGFLLYSPLLVLMKLHLYPNWKMKQKIFKHFFGGMDINVFNQICTSFARDNAHLLRPKGIALLKNTASHHQQIFIVSASIDNWVRPFFLQQGLDALHILGTQIEIANGKVTGQFKTKNCYGEEKVRCICRALNQVTDDIPFDRKQYEIIAFGDSRGDKEMLDFADQCHFKPFRE